MPRIRTIKPEFWDSPDAASASLRARLLYIAMWNWADDYGIGDATPVRLIGFAFPHDDIPASEYPTLLKEVETAFGVVFFRHSGRNHFVIPAWNTHQRTERKAKPREQLMAAALEAVAVANAAGRQADSESPCEASELPTPSEGSSEPPQGASGTGTEEQGNRGTGEEQIRSTAAPSNHRAKFAEFWDAYPRRQGKGAAEKAFGRAVRKAGPDVIIAAARRYADDPNRDPQYTAMASTWLNSERWTDDPLPARRPRAAPSTADDKVRSYLDFGRPQPDRKELE